MYEGKLGVRGYESWNNEESEMHSVGSIGSEQSWVKVIQPTASMETRLFGRSFCPSCLIGPQFSLFFLT